MFPFAFLSDVVSESEFASASADRHSGSRRHQRASKGGREEGEAGGGGAGAGVADASYPPQFTGSGDVAGVLPDPVAA